MASISCGGGGKALSGDADLPPADRAHFLSARARLASSKEFYAELSLRDREVRVCHSGVALRSFPLKSVELQKKRVLFFPLSGAARWNNRVLSEGGFRPERVIERVMIVPGDERTRPTPQEPGIIPPTWEEIIAVPQSFDLEFGGSFSIRFDLDGKVPGKTIETKKGKIFWDDFLTGLGLRKGPPVRLRITMDAAEGAAFYRTCPQPAELLITP